MRLKSANAHCNFGAPRALRRSLSVIHSATDLACRPGLTAGFGRSEANGV
jgi:hypothetical protein